MSAFSAVLPSWSTVALLLLIAVLALSYWVVRGVSVETLLASYRLVNQGKSSSTLFENQGKSSIQFILCLDMSLSKPQLPASLMPVPHLYSNLRTCYAPGSVTIGSYSLRDLALRDIVVTSPEHLGSHVVIKAKSVSLHPSWDVFKGAAPSLQHMSPKHLLHRL